MASAKRSTENPRSRRFGSALLAASVLGAAALALATSCLERRKEVGKATNETRCTSCHGDPRRAGDAVARSAPPFDLLGASDPAYPGVGAHAIHLNAGDTHGAIACSECHLVPEHVDTPGHADDARPAELVFGPIAKTGGRHPRYDSVARTCSRSHCHGDADAVWTEPRSSDEACGTCHGLPPPPPHPASERCHACHSEVIDERRRFVAPELHVNGRVETGSNLCSTCHGGPDSPAPPPDTTGATGATAIGVGAHEAHLTGGRFSRPLACTECHDVPERDDIASHVGPLPADVRLLGPAEAGDRSPFYDHDALTCVASWCHGPGPEGHARSPRWNEPGPLACNACHDLPPPAPHPASGDCSSCHGDVVAANDRDLIDRERHVDGIVDATTDQPCNTCHGDDGPAPPRDLAGNTDTDAPGVGAHAVHLAGTERSRPVPCGECHRVPGELLDPGHVDTSLPAEVRFSGAAVAFGDGAEYRNGTCVNTSCHGGLFHDGHDSGGTNVAPRWTRVDGSEATCGSCHGLPPPRPHPRGDLNPTCSACHENIDADNVTFRRPELHVDGVVTFEVP